MSPTLIELTEENSSQQARSLTTHVIEVEKPKPGETFQGFCFSKEFTATWFVNDSEDGPETEGTIHLYRFARSATPAEIAAHKPSAPSAEVLVPFELATEVLDELKRLQAAWEDALGISHGSNITAMMFEEAINGTLTEEFWAAYKGWQLLLAQREGTRS